MPQFLSEQDYLDLQPRIAAGTARLDVPRRVAREFFLRVSNQSVKDIADQSVVLKKCAIWLGVMVVPLVFIAAAAMVIKEFGWMSTIAVPLLGIFWTVMAGFTGDKGGFWLGSLALVVALIAAWYLPQDYGIPLALTGCSLWLHRLTFLLAQRWMISLISRSFAAFDMLIEHVAVIED